MITVIDNIQYLPTKSETILDTNYTKNIAVRSYIDTIKEKSKLINTNGNNVIVNIVGVLKIGSNFSWKMEIECNNSEISEMVRKELSQ